MVMCVCSCMVYATYVQVLIEGTRGCRVPESEVTGDWVIPKVDARKKMHVLQKNNK